MARLRAQLVGDRGEMAAAWARPANRWDHRWEAAQVSTGPTWQGMHGDARSMGSRSPGRPTRPAMGCPQALEPPWMGVI